jgi:hypothetical protein
MIFKRKLRRSCLSCSHGAMRRVNRPQAGCYKPVCRYQRTGKICSLKKILSSRTKSRDLTINPRASASRKIDIVIRDWASRLRRCDSSELARAAPHSGDNSAVAPPVPIPNTAVKRCSPDGSTAIGRARVGRRQNKTPSMFEENVLGVLLSDLRLGSARASRARERALAITNFFRDYKSQRAKQPLHVFVAAECKGLLARFTLVHIKSE